eukprot:528350-Rhodomonas_salina.2
MCIRDSPSTLHTLTKPPAPPGDRGPGSTRRAPSGLTAIADTGWNGSRSSSATGWKCTVRITATDPGTNAVSRSLVAGTNRSVRRHGCSSIGKKVGCYRAGSCA